MDFSLMSDDEVLASLGTLFEKMRLQKEISDATLMQKGGCSKDALWRFRNGEAITTKNFVKILRGLGELKPLEELFRVQNSFRPSLLKEPQGKKRVHSKAKEEQSFTWGEDS